MERKYNYLRVPIQARPNWYLQVNIKSISIFTNIAEIEKSKFDIRFTIDGMKDENFKLSNLT